MGKGKEMNKSKLNIFITGVGGQGIGLLSEALMKAYDHAGISVARVDTPRSLLTGEASVNLLILPNWKFESGVPLLI